VEARELEDGGAEVRVVDDGCGIAEADLPYVFERFYRGRERDSCGAGLGLAIVRSIVELHDGQVVIASTPGAGTEVTMRFPPRSAH
jgi:signal transduction histidine kinase